MLHIILLILKIIGWMLLAILGLIVLLVCVVVFVPLRYKAEASCKGTVDSVCAAFHFSWLFHLVGGHILYKEQKTYWNIRIAWKSYGSGMEQEKRAKSASKEDPGEAKEETDISSMQEKKASAIKEDIDSGNRERQAPAARERQPEAAEESGGGRMNSQKQERADRKEKPSLDKGKPCAAQKGQKEKNGNSRDTGQGRPHGIKARIRQIFRKIKYTFQKLCDNIKSLSGKKDKIKEFITDEAHRTAFGAVLIELKRILAFLKPRKLQANLLFGFEDPCLTGRVLAVLSILYPYLGGRTEIRPDFEHRVLKGEIQICGHIRGLYAVVIIWNLVWNRHVRTTFAHIRAFQW